MKGARPGAWGVCLALGCGGGSLPTTLAVGDAAPPFRLPDADGVPVSLSEHRGEVVVVAAHAMWCGPCQASVPRLLGLEQELPEEVVVLDVLVEDLGGDRPDSTDAARWRDAFEVGFPVLADEAGGFRRAWNRDGTVPRHFVVDRRGAITLVVTGPGPEVFDLLGEAVDLALAE